jgi:hypothetical protein
MRSKIKSIIQSSIDLKTKVLNDSELSTVMKMVVRFCFAEMAVVLQMHSTLQRNYLDVFISTGIRFLQKLYM